MTAAAIWSSPKTDSQRENSRFQVPETLYRAGDLLRHKKAERTRELLLTLRRASAGRSSATPRSTRSWPPSEWSKSALRPTSTRRGACAAGISPTKSKYAAAAQASIPPKAMQQAAQPFVLLYELAKIVLRDTELLMRTPSFGGKHLVSVLHRYLEAVDDTVPHIYDPIE